MFLIDMSVLKNKKKRGGFLFSIFYLCFFSQLFCANNIKALDNENDFFINLNQEATIKGYTVTAFDDQIKLSLMPKILASSTGVNIKKITNEVTLPYKLDLISEVYQFEFLNKSSYDSHKPFYIQFSYLKEDNNYKQVFFFDKINSSWRPLPTQDYPKEKFVRSLIHLPFARIAVFSYPNMPIFGKSSWYAYKNGNFTASPDFPKGSRLRIYNLSLSNKEKYRDYVDVVVNDYGPVRSLHPDRVVDLDKIAFKQIASLGAGIIDVKVEPLYIPDNNDRILGIGKLGALLEPDLNFKSFLVVDKSNDKILYSKQASSSLSIASLTKLISIKVFLDTNPDLSKIFAYKIIDEEENYKYCSKWEAAKLNLKEDEKMSLKDFVYSSLMASSNNTVETLVRASGLDRKDFIQKMNEFAKEVGASTTRFVEPSGLSPENISSAYDYYLMMKEILRDQRIVDISSLIRHKLKIYYFDEEEQRELERDKWINNTNKILYSLKYNIQGSKTGYLDEAGYCLAINLKSDNNEFIIITLGASSRSSSMLETEDLILYTLNKLSK